MAPQYGEVRVDYITYTTGVSPNEANVTVPVSGLVNNPTFSGNVIIEGNTTIDGDLTVSGSINASGVIISGITGLFDAGSVAAPSIAFALDPNTGFYNPDPNEIGMVTGGGERVRIDSAGNVGINRGNPIAKLDVDGTTQIKRPTDFWTTGPDFYSVANTGFLTTQGSNAVDITSNGYRNNGGTWTSLGVAGNTGASQLRLLPNGDMRFMVDATKASGSSVTPTTRMILTGAGDLGINTTSPAYKLDVLGIGSFRDTLRIARTTVAPTLLFNNSSYTGDDGSIGYFNSGAMVFKTNGNSNERMRINADGNVGIGEDNPLTLLHTLGSKDYTGSTPTIASYDVAFQSGTATVSIGQSNSIPAIQGSGSGTAYKLVLNPNAGNVGVGTTGPQAKLEVATDGNGPTDVEIARIRIQGATNNPMLRVLGNEDGNLITVATNGSNSNSEFQINTTSTEAVRIDKDGNVGVGTTNPTEKFEVKVLSSSAAVGVIRKATGSTASATIEATRSSSETSSILAFEATTDQGNCFNVNYAGGAYFKGNVGIGEPLPQQKLIVTGTTQGIRSHNSSVQSTDTNKALTVTNGSTSNTFSVSYKGTIFTSQRIGIGTSDPVSSLHISNSVPRLTLTDTDTGADHRINGDSSVGNLAFECDYNSTTSDPAVRFLVKGSEQLRITTAGLSINTAATPLTTLDVSQVPDVFTLNTNTVDYTLFLQAGNTGADDAYGASIGFSRIGGGSRTGAVIATKQTTSDADTQGIAFLTHASSSTNVNLQEQMLITHNGMVGIKTSNPLTTLDVAGKTFINRPLDFWTTGTDFYSLTSYGSLTSQGSNSIDLTCNGYRNNGGTWTSLGAAGNTGASQIRLKPTGDIQFMGDAVKASGSSVNPSTNMTLRSDGNLGLGTSSPSELLTLVSPSSTIAVNTNRSGTTFDNAVIIFGSPRSNNSDGNTTSGRGMLSCLGNSTSTTGIVWLQAASASLTPSETDADLKANQCGIRLASDGTFEHWDDNELRFRISSVGVVSIPTGFITLNNNKLGALTVTIADDAFATITPPRVGGGYYTIMEGGDEQFPNANARVMAYADWNSSPVNQAVNIGSNMELSTGGQPTGTTGTDGKATVYAGGTNGKMYLENRLNGAGVFFINFI